MERLDAATGSGARARRPGQYLGLLRRERDFRRVLVSELVSLGGDWFAIVPLLALLPGLTGTGLWGALVLAADTAVFAAVSPYAGAVADRLDRRKVMVAADLVCAALVLMLVLVRSAGTAWIALVALGGIAAAKAFYAPAAAAAVPNLVSEEDLPAAAVLHGAAFGTMLAVGATLGGIATAAVGARWCFVIDAASFAMSALLTWRTTKPFGVPRREERRPTVRADLRATVAYARDEPRVRALLACKVGSALGNGTVVLYPLVVVAWGYGSDVAFATGVLLSARGIGTILGPVAGQRIVRPDERRLWPVLAVSMLSFGAGYVAFAAARSLWAGALVVVIAHAGAGGVWVMSTYGLQRVVPDELRGRVFAFDYMISTVVFAGSQLLAGVAADQVSPRWVSLALGAAVVVYALGWLGATAASRSREWEGARSHVAA